MSQYIDELLICHYNSPHCFMCHRDLWVNIRPLKGYKPLHLGLPKADCGDILSVLLSYSFLYPFKLYQSLFIFQLCLMLSWVRKYGTDCVPLEKFMLWEPYLVKQAQLNLKVFSPLCSAHMDHFHKYQIQVNFLYLYSFYFIFCYLDHTLSMYTDLILS